MKIPYVICVVLLLGSGNFYVWGIRVTGNDFPTEALRGEDAAIPCLISEVPIPLNLSEVSITWIQRLQNGTEHTVYSFHDFHHQPFRSGAHMKDNDLKQGNASLVIPSLQINDDGEYRCFVTVNPNVGSATSTLHVSVKPQVTRSRKRRFETGLQETVVCEVRNFYPEVVRIQWVKYSKTTGTNSSLDKDPFSTILIRNDDGTFHVTSLILRPSGIAEPGDVLFCIVSHRSLKEEVAVQFTVTSMRLFLGIGLVLIFFQLMFLLSIFVHRLVKEEWKPFIIVIWGPVIITSLILFGFYIHLLMDTDGIGNWSYGLYVLLFILYVIELRYYGIYFWIYFKQGKPTISEISGDQFISHMIRTTLTFQIINLRQKEIQIYVYLKRLNDRKKQLMASWGSTDRTSSNNSSIGLETLTSGGHSGDHAEALPLVEEGPVKMKAKITKSCILMYKCQCFITITPNEDTDDGALLIVEVECANVKKPFIVNRPLHKDVLIVSDITGERWIPHMKRSALSCQIQLFRKKEIYINLYLKRHNDIKRNLLLSWVSVDPLSRENNIPSADDNIPLGENVLTTGHQSGDTSVAVHDTMLPVEMEVVMTKTRNGCYEYACTMFLTPNADTDDGAMLSMEVSHAALNLPIHQYQILNVIKGDKPSLWRRWRR